MYTFVMRHIVLLGYNSNYGLFLRKWKEKKGKNDSKAILNFKNKSNLWGLMMDNSNRHVYVPVHLTWYICYQVLHKSLSLSLIYIYMLISDAKNRKIQWEF